MNYNTESAHKSEIIEDLRRNDIMQSLISLNKEIADRRDHLFNKAKPVSYL